MDNITTYKNLILMKDAIKLQKGKVEAQISSSMISIQKEQLGRGAESAKTYIIDDMVIIRLKGVLTPAEKQLTLKQKGKCLIKELRYQLEELIRPELERVIERYLDRKVISLHNDISTKTGERIDIVVVDRKIEFDE